MWKKLRDFAHPEKDDRIAGGEPAPVFEDRDLYWRIGVTALEWLTLGRCPPFRGARERTLFTILLSRMMRDEVAP
jgi:hypothetical protein